MRCRQQIFKRYLDSLDSDRLFFTQTDIDRFADYKTKLDDAIYDQDLTAPFAIFNLYEQRVGERVAYARGLLPKGFDFSADESYQFDREKTPWAKSEAELDDLWRKRIKNDWLRLKLASKTDKDIRDTLDKRYANYLDRVRQLNSEDVFQTFMNSYAMAIEPHTNYLGPRASREFRHRDEAVARRHRRGAAARRGLHRDPRDRAGRSGRRCRARSRSATASSASARAIMARSSTWSAGVSTTSSRRSAARRTRSCASRSCRPMPAPTASTSRSR